MAMRGDAEHRVVMFVPRGKHFLEYPFDLLTSPPTRSRLVSPPNLEIACYCELRLSLR